MKPGLTVRTYVNVGLRKFKDASVRILLKPSADRLIQRRYLYVFGLAALLLACNVWATEVVIKNVGDALLVATDSKGSIGTVSSTGEVRGPSFGICKILVVGPNQYFSFAGLKGGGSYDIRREAMAAAQPGGSITEISARFLKSITPKVELYRDFLNLIETSNFTSVAFYGIENGRAICIKSRFYKTRGDKEIAVDQKTCPPSCEPFISLGSGDGVLEDWAARNPGVYETESASEVECLVRGA